MYYCPAPGLLCPLLLQYNKPQTSCAPRSGWGMLVYAPGCHDIKYKKYTIPILIRIIDNTRYHRIAESGPRRYTLPRAGRRGVLNPIFGDIFIYITERCRHLTATRVTTAAARDHRQLQSARGSSQNLPL